MRSLPTLTLLRDDGVPVVDRCSVADTRARRLRGLRGRGALADGEGMVLRPAHGVSTSFLTEPIDAIFLGADQTVLRIVAGLKPFRYAGCRGARDVVETRAGTCRERQLEEGRTVVWAAFSPSANGGEAGPAWSPQPDRKRVNGGPARVLLCSADRDFLRLTRFLLEHHDVEVDSLGRPERVVSAVGEQAPHVLVLDAGARVVETGRLLAAVEALNRDVEVVLVADEPRSLAGLEIREKWGVLDTLLETVAHAHG